MSHSHPNKHIPYCLNCHYPLAEMDNFCPNCGQKPTDGKTTMHDLIHEFVHTLFHLDGKFFTTLKHIFVPGKLTTEFFKGHHKRYAHPVQLFLVLGAILFGMIASSTSKFEKSLEEKEYKSRQKVEEKAFLLLLDSIGDVTAPAFEGKKTQQAYDSLLMNFYKHSLKKELKTNKDSSSNKDKTKQIQNTKDTIYSFAGGALKITKEIDAKPNKKAEEDIRDTNQEESNWNDFKRGVNDGLKAKDKDEDNDDLTASKAIDNNLKKLSLKDILEEEDSTLIGQLFTNIKIPSRELYELTPDQILEKHKIHGFWKRLSLKQGIKISQDSKSLLHFVMGKLLWFTLLLIPMMSGLFMLLYRKKKYFVEHFIFFMHYNIFLFAGSILLIFINDKFGFKGLNSWFTLSVFVFFYFAMKNYYQQSWRKTFVKFCVANFGYMFFSILLTILGGILSFLLF